MSCNKAATVSSGNLPKASSVGANTVKGPSPLRVSTKSAASSAATSVVRSSLPAAISAIGWLASEASDDRVDDVPPSPQPNKPRERKRTGTINFLGINKPPREFIDTLYRFCPGQAPICTDFVQLAELLQGFLWC